MIRPGIVLGLLWGSHHILEEKPGPLAWTVRAELRELAWKAVWSLGWNRQNGAVVRSTAYTEGGPASNSQVPWFVA